MEIIPTMLSMLMSWIPSIWVRFSPQMLGLLILPHYALFVAAMDSVNLGEVLSPNAWATTFISRWRVLDGGCPSLNKVAIVVLIWSSGDDMMKVHYPSVAWCKNLVG
ncbi:hypothetical protein NC652_022323 [Populus alba x Populus x berolinensis]|nr:hypothetical protein NC652_022323 [Populus alba x Populus x berolinensis]